MKHGIGDVGHHYTATEGSIVDVRNLDGETPSGSSAVQIRVKVGMVLEGFREGGSIRRSHRFRQPAADCSGNDRGRSVRIPTAMRVADRLILPETQAKSTSSG